MRAFTVLPASAAAAAAQAFTFALLLVFAGAAQRPLAQRRPAGHRTVYVCE